MKLISTIFYSIIIVLTLSFCTTKEKTSIDLVLLNTTIVDVQNIQLLENQFIAIKGDTIFSTGSMEEIPAYDSKESMDLQGRFAMPGLWDNHVHFRGGTDLIAENQDLLGLFPKFGVTTVRDAGGDMTPAAMGWAKKINQKELLGPQIFTSGPKLDGPKPAWEGSIKIVNLNDIEMALDSLESINVDYVKIYDGSLSAENFYSIIKATEKRSMKVTGHMPMSADFQKAVSLGMDGSEHMYYIMKACSPKADSLTELGLGYGMMETITETYDKQMANELFAELAEKKVFITPTLYIGKVLSNIADEDHSTDTLLSEIGVGIQKTYEGRVESAKRAKSSGSQMREKVSNLAKEMIRPMFEAGVPILAGSDCGPFNSFVYPGEALWGELFSLVEAGLTPAEALKTSMIYGPAFFGLENQYGSLEKGKVANIIILKENPLEDIQHLRSLGKVFLKGVNIEL
ncbi:amidohydrolase [Marivirga tractuosa]|uniref:Amidohydrolase n=1 Tax=Marivirga tractuosa (strain ATCC 23168 / DSM 4126 / NBRC 15989 / NCIMB 1408 / VKM B-1430 / H-43) TaxID=643867 RepID=E4TPC6_MARTH|nr:amidohydrolase family protein [Marivirga tractuosa]ADR21514.1 amidohydrolase [Marivirga tractuosa DSM 4126]BDD14032.1 amidohydrolase [Marivirga tractuosa]